MKEPTDQDKRLDQLVDRVATRLREQPIPSMPEELHEWEPFPKHNKSLFPTKAVAFRAIAVAAGVLLVLGFGIATVRLLRDSSGTSTSPNPLIETANTIESEEIEVEEILVVANFEVLSEQLDAIDLEIRQLKQQATLLDARRKANELLNILASTR